METGQLELTVEHNGCCEGLEVAVLSPDYRRHELNWMHKKKRGGGRGCWKQNNNVATPRSKHATLALSAGQCQRALVFSMDVSHCSTNGG